MKTMTSIVKIAVAAGVLGLSVSANAATIYGLNAGQSGGGIYKLDPLSGVSSLTFTTPALVGKDGNGLAFDQPNNTFYYVGDGATPQLYRRNGSGETALVKLTGSIASAAYLNNTYYYVQQNTNKLHRVNLTTLIDSPLTMNGIKSAGYGDIAFAPDGTLWGASDQQLFKFDIGANAGTEVKTGVGNLQLGFYNGSLYGVQTATDKIFAINLLNGNTTLSTTLVNRNLTIQDAAGLVMPENPNVPEPGTVALFVGMGVSGLVTLRRRARK